jgi:RND family efflux transporter MFP subunit
MSALRTSVRVIVQFLIIALGVFLGWGFIKSTKKPEKKRPQRTAYAAEVVPLTSGTQVVELRATGTVIASTLITLRSRVGGEIVEVSPNFIAGGRYKQGDLVLKLDPVDYQLALEQKKAALAEAEFQLKLEEGQSVIAAREWELIASEDDSSEVDRELAMRVPHLKYRAAKRDAAIAELEKATLDLARTEISAPFNGIVVERKTDLGAQASVQDALATLANTDVFYVQASIPVDRLKWIKCDAENGSLVKIVRGTGAVREGRIIRLESSLEPMGRMARILVAIKNPMQGDHPMLLNEYVRIEIEGSSLEDAYQIPRAALHDDRVVWLATPESTLEIREVTVGWRDATDVIISGGLQDGERLILTNLSTPINGMQLRIAGDPDPAKDVKGAGDEKRGKGPKQK